MPRVSIDCKWPLNGQKVRIQLLSDSHEKGENLFSYFPVQKRNIRREAKMYIVRLVNCLEMSFVQQQQKKNGRGGVRAIVVEENSSKKDQNSPCGKMSIKVFFIKGPGSRRIGLHTLCY